jgi:hypothetical protein
VTVWLGAVLGDTGVTEPAPGFTHSAASSVRTVQRTVCNKKLSADACREEISANTDAHDTTTNKNTKAFTA